LPGGGRPPLRIRRAFTLAEVLITLGVIGVVAALTMPSLITKYKEKEAVSKLKKVYATFGNAYTLAANENGTPDNWYTNEGHRSVEAANRMVEVFLPYLKVAKVCKQEKGCWADTMYKKPDGTNATNWDTYNSTISRFMLSDGTSVFFHSYANTPVNLGDGFLSESYGGMSVDINGKKAPNKWGVDTFSFILTKNGIVPGGTDIATSATGTFPAACNRTNVPAGWGEACAAWVIYNENMDYLHCDDLSWNGKTKCD
jgi:prepilin-type N-terminal cleavage/methylation domain-containing protein